MIVGLMGAKGSGKDTVADLLVKNHAFVKVAFADPLREIAEAIDPVVSYTEVGGGRWSLIRYNEALDRYGYRDAKEMFPELRRFLQRLGTEAGRELIHPDFWVDRWRENVMDMLDESGIHQNVVASDCRFQNEVDVVRMLGGEVWTILRPDCDPEDEHESERYWREIEPDWEIDNDGTLKDLEQEIAAEAFRVS